MRTTDERAATSGDVPFGFDRLHVEAIGPPDAEPVLLLHGWGSRADHMQPIAAALSDTYRVHNVDLPGHGHSPVPPVALGVPEHGELIAELIRERTGGPVTIVGHSNGGRIALYMAGEPVMKHLVRRLVLVSPSGITPERSAGFYVRRALARTLKAPFEILPPRMRAFGLDWLRNSLLWRALGSSDYRTLEGVMRETFVKTVTFHLDDRLDRIEVPTLIVWGDQDTAVSRRQMDILEKGIHDAGLVVLHGAGHYGYLDDFETFMRATHYFLAHAR